jgi:type I restriction enzyme S subunit
MTLSLHQKNTRLVADVLNTIQQAIAVQEQVIQAAREVKRSLMRRLFTYGPYAEERPTKETEIGDIPEYWEMQTIGQLCEKGNGTVQTGPFGSQLHASDYIENGVPSVMPQDIVDNRIVATNIAQIAGKDHRRLARYHLRIGDIVYARRGDIGRRALVTENEDDWLCSTGSLFIRTGNSGIESRYLYYYLGLPTITSWITSRAVGTIMMNLNTRILKSIPVAFPPRDEQSKISGILDYADQKIVIEENRKAVLEVLFKSMLHKLITGQIRTPA